MFLRMGVGGQVRSAFFSHVLSSVSNYFSEFYHKLLLLGVWVLEMHKIRGLLYCCYVEGNFSKYNSLCTILLCLWSPNENVSIRKTEILKSELGDNLVFHSSAKIKNVFNFLLWPCILFGKRGTVCWTDKECYGTVMWHTIATKENTCMVCGIFWSSVWYVSL